MSGAFFQAWLSLLSGKKPEPEEPKKEEMVDQQHKPPCTGGVNEIDVEKSGQELAVEMNVDQPLGSDTIHWEITELPFPFFEDQELQQDEEAKEHLIDQQNNVPGSSVHTEPVGWDTIQWKYTDPEELQFPFFEDQELRQDEEAKQAMIDQQNKPIMTNRNLPILRYIRRSRSGKVGRFSMEMYRERIPDPARRKTRALLDKFHYDNDEPQHDRFIRRTCLLTVGGPPRKMEIFPSAPIAPLPK